MELIRVEDRSDGNVQLEAGGARGDRWLFWQLRTFVVVFGAVWRRLWGFPAGCEANLNECLACTYSEPSASANESILEDLHLQH